MIQDIKDALGKVAKDRIVLGFDLSDEFSQISYSYMNDEEPNTVSAVLGGDEMCIPTMLAKYEGESTWTFGYEAKKLYEEGGGTVVGGLLQLAREGKPVKVEDKEYNPVDLLALYMKKCFSLLSLTAPIEKVSIIVIAVDRPDSEMIDILTKAINTLRIKPEKVFFQSHSESAYQYVIHQPKELWNHDVLICHLKDDGLFIRSLKKYVNTSPIVMVMEEQKFDHISALELKNANASIKNKMDQAFCHVLYGLCEDNYISSIYLLGEAFEGDWFRDSLKYMSKNRRIFGGNNLFSKGAAYGAREKIEESEVASKHVFLGKDKVKANVGMNAIKDGQETYIPLLDAGRNWYETLKEMDFIIDNEDTITFIVTPLNGKNVKNVPVYLTGIPQRDSKATRIHVELRMLSERKMSVKITDLGFGQFYQPSGLVWNSEIVLD